MGLLSPELEYVLPPVGSQDDQAEPIVYAHFVVPDHAWSYVTEGQRRGQEYAFFGFLRGGEEDKRLAVEHRTPVRSGTAARWPGRSG